MFGLPQMNRRTALIAFGCMCMYIILLLIVTNNNIVPMDMWASFRKNHVSLFSSDTAIINVTTETQRTRYHWKKPAMDFTKFLEANARQFNDPEEDSSVMPIISVNVESSNDLSDDKNNDTDGNGDEPELVTRMAEVTRDTSPGEDIDEVEPLIVMFTTFKSSKEKEFIYKNTIRNWGMLRPFIIPVLYTSQTESSIAEYARKHGWATRGIPKKSSKDVPILRHMFLDAQNTYNTPFFGYTNGDILYNIGLVETLAALVSSHNKLKQVLIVGRRTNFQMKDKQEINNLGEIGEDAKRGKVFSTNAQDYFISTRDGYPWTNIPDFVVGRIGYDNWLVVTAIVRDIPVIDATETVTALHQTDKDGNHAGHSNKPSGDKMTNYGLAGNKFDYSLGHVTCSQFLTAKKDGKVVLKERSKNGCEKLYKKKKRNPYIHLKRRLL